MAEARLASRLEVEANPGGFGARLTGVDLRQPLAPEDRDAIFEAWHAHQVISFPDQPLAIEELEAFTLAMGTWGKTDFIEPVKGHPNVLELRREPDEKSAHFGAGWHSDYSFQKQPPAGTLLLSKVVPPVGGDTLFADQYAAYETLDEEMKARIAPLRALHSAARPYSREGFYANEGEARTMKIVPSDEARVVRAHPLVRTHPATGRRALYVNPVYTVGIEGMEKDEAAELLAALFAHSTADRFVWRHRWDADTLVMWDNRCVQHFAVAGFDGHRRVMWRTTTAGEVPV